MNFPFMKWFTKRQQRQQKQAALLERLEHAVYTLEKAVGKLDYYDSFYDVLMTQNKNLLEGLRVKLSDGLKLDAKVQEARRQENEMCAIIVETEENAINMVQLIRARYRKKERTARA